jgi:hypothetical protein
MTRHACPCLPLQKIDCFLYVPLCLFGVRLVFKTGQVSLQNDDFYLYDLGLSQS